MKNLLLLILLAGSTLVGCSNTPGPASTASSSQSPTATATQTQTQTSAALVGRWESTAPPKGFIEFTTGGQVATYSEEGEGVMRTGKYRESKPGTVEQTWPMQGEETSVQEPTYVITGDELVLSPEGDPPVKYKRMAPAGSGVPALVGLWHDDKTSEADTLFELTDQGTFVMTIKTKDGDSSGLAGTYSAEGDKLIIKLPNDQNPDPFPYKVEGEKLTLIAPEGEENKVMTRVK